MTTHTDSALRKEVINCKQQPISVAARSKAWVCGRSLIGTLGSNPVGGMDVCLLSGRGLWDGPITRPEPSCRVWCVLTECDRIASIMRKLWPTRGFCVMKKKSRIKAEEEVMIAEPLQCLSPVPNRRLLVTMLLYMKPVLKLWTYSSCLHRASTVSKHLFIIPTDAHNYKITGMLKQLKSRQLLRHVSVHAGNIIR